MADYRSRMYESYATTHSGVAVDAAAMRRVMGRQIAPLVGVRGPVLDIGCGQGLLVQELLSRGVDARGIDTSPEMVELAKARGLPVERADLLEYLARHRTSFAAICAVDVLEHFDKPDVLRVLDAIRAALVPSGVLVARSPNGGSPFSGYYRYGDFTHGLSFTATSVRQILAVSGFEDVQVLSCPPVVHGARSALRGAIWKLAESAIRLALSAETGHRPGSHVVTQNLMFRAVRSG